MYLYIAIVWENHIEIWLLGRYFSLRRYTTQWHTLQQNAGITDAIQTTTYKQPHLLHKCMLRNNKGELNQFLPINPCLLITNCLPCISTCATAWLRNHPYRFIIYSYLQDFLTWQLAIPTPSPLLHLIILPPVCSLHHFSFLIKLKNCLFFVFLTCPHKRGRGIRTSDLCFIRRGPSWLSYLLGTKK